MVGEKGPRRVSDASVAVLDLDSLSSAFSTKEHMVKLTQQHMASLRHDMTPIPSFFYQYKRRNFSLYITSAG